MLTDNDIPACDFLHRTHVTLSDIATEVSDLQRHVHSAEQSFDLGPTGLPPAVLNLGGVAIPFFVPKLSYIFVQRDFA